MKKIAAGLLSVWLAVSCCACQADTADDTGDRYILQMPHYQIYEEGLGRYTYRITHGDEVLVENVKTGTAPRIEDKGDGVLRLHLGFGTNAFTVQYIDVYERAFSEEFHPYSIYADYADAKTGEYYIAYFKHEAQPKLYIEGFFESADFSNALDLSFGSPHCEKLLFLNESELYIEYTDVNGEHIRTVVNYKV